MVLIFFQNIIAIALPSLRISPLFIARITAMGLIYALTLLISVIYIQSIGSGIIPYGGVFNLTPRVL
jgi:hypothetical protein